MVQNVLNKSLSTVDRPWAISLITDRTETSPTAVIFVTDYYMRQTTSQYVDRKLVIAVCACCNSNTSYIIITFNVKHWHRTLTQIIRFYFDDTNAYHSVEKLCNKNDIAKTWSFRPQRVKGIEDIYVFFFSRSWSMFGDEVLHFNPIQWKTWKIFVRLPLLSII